MGYRPRPMTDVMRTCKKTGCRWPAAAQLAFRYASREVWLSDLGEEHPSTYDLCPHHADAQTVPHGWTLHDVRTVKEVRREPSAAEIAERAAALRESADEIRVVRTDTRRNRYAELVAALPRLAAEQAEGEAAPHAVIARLEDPAAGAARREEEPAPPPPVTTAAAGPRPRVVPKAVVVVPPVPPAHELAPSMPADAPLDPRYQQLQIPLPPSSRPDGGTVVPFRRRASNPSPE